MENTWFIAAVWIGMALAASVISIRVGISVALVEVLIGIFAGNVLGLQTTTWIDFLAGFGAVLLTFLAGAEVDPTSLRKHLKPSLAIGVGSFLLPFAAGFGFASLAAHWDLRSALVAGVALSPTSVAIVYFVMIETGLNETDLGKLLLSSTFVTGMGTLLALAFLFTPPGLGTLAFGLATLAVLCALPRTMRWVVRHFGGRVSEPEVKFLLLVLFGLGWLASAVHSEAVLPAYLVGLVVAGLCAENRALTQRLRSIAFGVLTPFYFLKAGLLVLLSAVLASLGLVAAFLGIRLASKLVGVWPITRKLRMDGRDGGYVALLMSTDLTFGSIAGLYGLTNGLIDRSQYTVLAAVVIISAIGPMLIAQAFFSPHQSRGVSAAPLPTERARTSLD